VEMVFPKLWLEGQAPRAPIFFGGGPLVDRRGMCGLALRRDF
jgi:hypothetical protein